MPSGSLEPALASAVASLLLRMYKHAPMMMTSTMKITPKAMPSFPELEEVTVLIHDEGGGGGGGIVASEEDVGVEGVSDGAVALWEVLLKGMHAPVHRVNVTASVTRRFWLAPLTLWFAERYQP